VQFDFLHFSVSTILFWDEKEYWVGGARSKKVKVVEGPNYRSL